jgi:UDP-GlcNAc:undecaprenyl-phosphate GlcNAc-1-phosphate transferase
MLFVGGAAHSLNIIDGYNGLASSYALCVLLAILVVAGQVQDIKLVYASAGAIAATLGFFVINFPSGRLFLGDSGAYLLGTVIAFLLTILVYRNPAVSPMFAAVLLVYPVWETLFSIYRKKVLRGTSPMQPDGVHLHMLIYKRLVRTNRPDVAQWRKIDMNSATTPYTLAMSAGTASLALAFWQDTGPLFLVFWGFIAGYLSLYFSLVNFCSPTALAVRHAWRVRGKGRRQAPAASGEPIAAHKLPR